jgi:hypothetical protein
MRKLIILASVAVLTTATGSYAMSYFTPANVTIGCTIAQAVEGAVLADEQLANQISGKQVVRTGTTATVQNVTPAVCAQIQQAAAVAQAAALAAKQAKAAQAPAPAPVPAK